MAFWIDCRWHVDASFHHISFEWIRKENKVDDSFDCSGYRYHDAINCPGIKWEYCAESGDENFDTGCDKETSEIEISQQAYIPFDGDLLNDFNQLSDNDLETSLGKIKSPNSLNHHMAITALEYGEHMLRMGSRNIEEIYHKYFLKS